MTEPEILEAISARSDSIWTLVQFWISLSFAAILAIHYTNKELGKVLIVTLLVLYTGYSLAILRSLSNHSDVQQAAWSMMAKLEKEQRLSPIGQQSLDGSREAGRLLLPLVVVTTYGSTMIYIGSSLFRRRDREDDQQKRSSNDT